jgi:hypothetical protein
MEAGMTEPTVKSVRDEFNAALDFALDETRGDLMGADAFLRLWREGEFGQLAVEWPEWVEFRKARKLPSPYPGSGTRP